MKIDDSALLHGRVYDPVKAHEYYLKTRKLKGRQPRSESSPGGRRITRSEFKDAATGNEGKYAADRKESRRKAHAQAVKRLEELEGRLDRLKNLLAERVAAAKRRSGIEVKESPSKKAEKSSSDKKGGSSDRKSTAKEKRDAAERARKSYEKNKKANPSKNHDPSVAKQIEQVEKEIREVRQKLKEATARARKVSEEKSKTKTETSKGRRQ